MRGRKGRFVGKSCTLPLLDRLSMLEGREVGAHWERMSRCQRDKLHTVCNVCIGERKHSPVIGRAKESPFLAVGGETLDQRERRTGVKRWSIAHRRRKVWDEGKCTCTVVMYDFLGRVLSDYANSAYEIYNTHLCLFLADDAGMTRSDIAWPVGIQSTFVEFVFRSGHGSSSTQQLAYRRSPILI